MAVVAGAEVTRTFTAEDLLAGRGTGLGNIVTTPDSKSYKMVLYDEGTGALDLVAGDLVCYVDATGYSANTVTADTSDISGTPLPAGIVAATTVTVDGTYFYVQLTGEATAAETLAGSPGDGSALMAAPSTDKTLTLAAEAGSGGYDHVCAYAIDASADLILCAFNP